MYCYSSNLLIQSILGNDLIMPPPTIIICFTHNILDEIHIYYDIESNNIDKCVHDPMVVKYFKCQNDSFQLAACNVGPKSLGLNSLSTYVI